MFIAKRKFGEVYNHKLVCNLINILMVLSSSSKEIVTKCMHFRNITSDNVICNKYSTCILIIIHELSIHIFTVSEGAMHNMYCVNKYEHYCFPLCGPSRTICKMYNSAGLSPGTILKCMYIVSFL